MTTEQDAKQETAAKLASLCETWHFRLVERPPPTKDSMACWDVFDDVNKRAIRVSLGFTLASLGSEKAWGHLKALLDRWMAQPKPNRVETLPKKAKKAKV